ncbi:manganese-dependent inorganic pyrophosphatase [Pseudogracilibacillus auburnensis]|uniref:Probable manganese-dependent inorganic pyrophosphatase n=1 Tax=Pseudogracilibacillus auburnensis TaxID=1494959 RepID=A0A2V3VY52_9BACI|nr:manganese-dependent inorganic pyrophosphatase [Pseudogracilibacillus auburnensis]MBO1005922.1 manganese-dependent inorganic pyrophosphatase [Pseudogracilibacillus auburnensis]PXW86937.1 manganese-dependent inorganic pyrophosphatase [Pseudogracilibacillus auburnensis]
MGKTFIFGHKNPDTDSICSAIVYANLKETLDFDVEAVRLGALNKETEYVLHYAKQEAPRLIEKVEEDVEQVILVDHNEFQQSVDNIRDVKIAEVIDHHRIANFETADPLLFRAEPVGCTATILNKMFKEKNVEISKTNALLLLSAIVSDTLLFKSPTCTEEDVAAARELANIAEVNVEEYGLDMLKAGTDLSDKTITELLSMDAKEFTMGSSKVEIAQINAVDIAEIYKKQAEFETEMKQMIETKGLDLFLLVVTDIIHSNSEVLALGKASKNVEDAFQVNLAANRALLEGVVSRKKQIVTNLGATFH